MGAPAEVGFIFQCSLCGSYAIFAIDALDPAEVASRAWSGHKTLQRELHAVEQDMLEAIQRRVLPFLPGAAGDSAADAISAAGSVEGATGRPQRVALLPCATCVEIVSGRTYGEWLDDKSNLEQAAMLCPQAAVTFETSALPPAYKMRSGRWCLAQGVGPKDLELKPPHRLPAGQFRTLLPVVAPPLRPPCWAKADAAGSAADNDSPQDWDDRKALIQVLVELAEVEASRSASASTKAAARQAQGRQAFGTACGWLDEFCDAAEEAWRVLSESGSRSGSKAASARGAAAAKAGGCYFHMPLLSVAGSLRAEAETRLQLLLSEDFG